MPEDLDPLYEKSGLIHYAPKEPIVRVCEPACKIVGSCFDNGAAQVFFEPVSRAGSLFRRVVFTRKIDHQREPRLWTVAARHGEIATFGFDSWNSKDQRYLPLAYPGRELDGFAPVYFKIQRKEENDIYLEVCALDDEISFLAAARRINEEDAPTHLRSAKPS